MEKRFNRNRLTAVHWKSMSYYCIYTQKKELEREVTQQATEHVGRGKKCFPEETTLCEPIELRLLGWLFYKCESCIHPADKSESIAAAQLVFSSLLSLTGASPLWEACPLCSSVSIRRRLCCLLSLFSFRLLGGKRRSKNKSALFQFPANSNQLAESLLVHSSAVTASDTWVKLHTHTHVHPCR